MYGGKSCKWFSLAAVLLLPMCGNGADLDTLPAPLQRCRFDDEACMIKQAQTFIGAFRAGIPERGVPQLDVIRLGTLSINSGSPGSSAEFNLVLSNTTLNNFVKTMVFKSIKGFSRDLTKPMKLTWSVISTGVDVYADYDVKGKILILPIVSQGKMVVQMNDLKAKSRITAVPEKRDDGKVYLKITEYKTVAKTDRGHINMTNLFNDNPELRDSTLKVLNDQYEVVSADVQPEIMRACDRVFMVALKRFWDTIPYDNFFENE